MRKTAFDRVPHIKKIVIGIAIVFLIFVGLLLLQKWESTVGIFPSQETEPDVLEYNGTEYVLKDGVEAFLVLGLDKFEGSSAAESYNNDKQADFLMLFVFDNSAKEYTAIHINRDTMVNVNVLGVAGNKIDTVYKQIALSHTYGNGKDLSCHNTADSVSSLLMGIKVNHYVSMTMESVAILNDQVGGVEVVVLDDFTGIDDTLVKGETVKLQGTQALTYVRTRKDLEDSSNGARMKRQQQYVSALRDAFDKCREADSEFVANVALKMSDHMISDKSVTQLQALANKFSEYKFLGIEEIDGEFVLNNELMEFHPNQESINEMIIRLFYVPKDNKGK